MAALGTATASQTAAAYQVNQSIMETTTVEQFLQICRENPAFRIEVGSVVDRTVLHQAAHKDNFPLMEHICKIAPTLINRVSGFQHTPLHEVAKHGNFDAAKMLIDMRAAVNVVDACGFTPLAIAVSNAADPSRENCRIRDFALVRLLLAHGGKTESALTPEEEALRERAMEANKRPQRETLEGVPSLRLVPVDVLSLVAGYAPLAPGRVATPPTAP